MTIVRNTFVTLAAVLLGIGLLMVYSASITARPTAFDEFYLARHLQFLAIAVLAGVIAGLLPSRFWIRFAPWLYAITVLLLIAVLIPGVGHRVNGAQRWLRYGPISLQPSELAKIALPLFICWCSRGLSSVGTMAASQWTWKRALIALLATGVIMVLVTQEPDLGTAAFLGGGALLAFWLSGWPHRYFLLAGGAALPAALGLVAIRPYQLARIQGFIAAWRDIDQAPYQVRQSLTTLGVGGIRGVGLGSGQQKLSFLPEANTDFVFAVLGEELGLVGTLGLIGLWLALFLTGLRLLSRNPVSSFEFCAGCTLLTQIVLQAALNVAVVTAMAPPKGIAHPLISYGGSSLVVTVVVLGIVVSLSRAPEVLGNPLQNPSSRAWADA